MFSTDKALARLAELVHYIHQSIDDQSAAGSDAAFPRTRTSPAMSLQLSEKLDTYCRTLPDYYCASDFDLYFDFGADMENGAHATSADASMDPSPTNETDTSAASTSQPQPHRHTPTHWELEKWYIHFHISFLRVHTLVNVVEVPGSHSAVKDQRQSLCRAARSNICLARKLCRAWPNFLTIW